MIELLEGVPGAGKSYHAVAEYLLPWVRKGRRIYVYVDGFYLDRLAKFEDRSLDELEAQITVWNSGTDVLDQLTTVEPGSAVFIDECQTVFRSQQRISHALLRWLETHRHYGVDVLLICQDYRQVTSGVTRLVEMTTKFRRLDRFGFSNRYQAFVRGNPEEVETIRGFTGRYDPRVYSYYGSYATATKEVRQVRSILRSPSIILGALGLCLALGWFLFGGGTFRGSSTSAVVKEKDAVRVAATPSVPVLAGSIAAPVPNVRPIRIQGGMSDPRKDGDDEWLWVAEDGRLLTVDEIAAESGGTVRVTVQRGVHMLKGSGVIWGGATETRTQATDLHAPVAGPSKAEGFPMTSSVTAGISTTATGTPFSTTPDLLKSDPKNDLLKSPSDLR
ncbi:MAG TPA: zonular occludens toxin domain-containing protein [Nitrospira sp.]|nr:zonular occludens toxin domain-containing protein [Nitrospira sp.]